MMMKLHVYNVQPHFGKGIVSLLMLVQSGCSLRSACAQMGLSYSKAWRLLKGAEADLGLTLLVARKGGVQRAGSRLTPEGETLLHRYLAFEKEARQAVFCAFEKYFGPNAAGGGPNGEALFAKTPEALGQPPESLSPKIPEGPEAQ